MNDASSIFNLYTESTQKPEMHMDDRGTKRWTLNNKFHREDGAAIEYANGAKVWFIHGKLHRINGPAIEYDDGSKEWYLHGERHRIDGAAVENANGDVYWYVAANRCDDISEWAEAALAYEQQPVTQDAIDDKIIQVMQADLFA